MLIRTIFLHEWRQFLRQQWMPASLVLFIILSLLSIGSGNKAVRLRYAQIDSIKVAYQNDYRIVLKKFSDTLTPEGKTEAKNAGMPVMINYRLPQTAIKQPGPLAGLATGLMDVQPWYKQIKYTTDYSDVAPTPVSNPMVLFSGNFDYSFVLVYLLPLLVIVFCNSIFASEKDAGTLPLLTVQAGRPDRLVRLKILFRLVLLATVLVLLNSTAFVVAGRRVSHNASALLYWIAATWAYLTFWIAVAYLVLALKKNGMVTAFYLISTWLLLLIIIPSLIISYATALYPLPMKDEIDSYRRHQSEEIWKTSAKILSDSFNHYYPQYASTIDPAKDTLHLSDRYVAGYYDLLERRMNRKLAPYHQQLTRRNELMRSLLQWNPAPLTSQLLNSLSNNLLIDYRDFNRQADQFQKQWQAFLYPYHFAHKKLTPGELTRLPAFRYQQPAIKASELLKGILYLTALAILFFWAGVVIERKKHFVYN